MGAKGLKKNIATRKVKVYCRISSPLGQDLVVELEEKNQLDYQLYKVAQNIASANLPQPQP